MNAEIANTNYLIDLAMKKYPKAKRIAVSNFTHTCDGWDMAASMNLSADARAYGWNNHTVAAIKYVLGNKRKTALL